MIIRTLMATFIAGLALTSGGVAAEETVEAKIKDLTLNVPKSWKSEEPASRLRVGQFKIPAVKGDKEDAEMAIFNFGGGGGGVSSNVQRWIGQYNAEGREVKITQGEAKLGKYVCVELSGTYNKSVGPPIAGKKVAVPGSRTLAVILAMKDKNVYYLKLVGPDKTVTAQATALRAAFGAKAADEKELKQ